MLTAQYIKNNTPFVKECLLKRSGVNPAFLVANEETAKVVTEVDTLIANILKLEDERRSIISKLQTMQEERNDISNYIGYLTTAIKGIKKECSVLNIGYYSSIKTDNAKLKQELEDIINTMREGEDVIISPELKNILPEIDQRNKNVENVFAKYSHKIFLTLLHLRRKRGSAFPKHIVNVNVLDSLKIHSFERIENHINGMKYNVSKLNEDIEKHDTELKEVEKNLDSILHGIPNILDERVPFGNDETSNEVLRMWGTKPTFRNGFKPLQHFDVGTNLGMMHFETAVRISGSRFSVLSGDLARLARALQTFMFDVHLANGFAEVNFPHLVNENSMFGTGQLPKFEDDFRTTDGLHLIPTGEVPLTNLVSGQIIDKSLLSLRLVGYSECYRKEAGGAGRDTRGMLRQHQFGKVELVCICSPEESESEHNKILASSEEILQKLGLHYRVCNLCTGDIGFCSKLTYDIEVWLPAQNTYREIASCSNTGNFQSHRMQAKCKDQTTKRKEYLHTLNGSGLPIGRTIVAILENYQNKDGTVTIPPVLIPYLGKNFGNKIIPSSNLSFLK